MYSRDLHLKVNRSSIAVLTCSDCDQAMKDCEFSEKGKTCTYCEKVSLSLSLCCVMCVYVCGCLCVYDVQYTSGMQECDDTG